MPRSKHPAFSRSTVERLEDRIAPAVLVNAKTLTFIDTDGDAVTLTITKGTLTEADFGFDTAFADSGRQQLQLIDFSGDHDKLGTDLSITSEPGNHVVNNGAATGDGAVNVGYINATGIDLGKVTVDGNLGRIDAGDASATTPAVKRLEVATIGVKDIATQATGGNLTSNIKGPLTALTTTGDIQSATLLVSGKIGSIDIGGGLLGGSAAQSGSIRATGAIGSLHVTLDVHGGAGTESGEILSNHDLAIVTIDGSIVGSDTGGDMSGRVFAGGTIGVATIGHDIIGGVGSKSGQLASVAGMGIVQIGGSVTGGAGFESGAVGSGGTIQSIHVTHDLVGYVSKVAGEGESSGALLSSKKILNVTIGGDIEGGSNLHSGVIATDRGLGTILVTGSVFGSDGVESGAIGSKGPITKVHVMGSLDGGEGGQSGEIVSTKSIGKVIVDGDVFGGGGPESGAIGAIGAINSVQVGGNVIGSTGTRSGWISSQTNLKSVNIDGALGAFDGEVAFSAAGRAITDGSSTEVSGSGLISGPVIGTIVVGAIGSPQDSFDPGTIQGGAIGSITVNDSIYSGFFTAAFISARTISTFTVTNDVFGVSPSDGPGIQAEINVRSSLGTLTIGGDARDLNVIAGGGFDSREGPANPDAHIGTVKVSGDWVASSVVAGVLSGEDGQFGTLDDVLVNGGNPDVISSIARIQINGDIFDGAPPAHPYGFIAQQVSSIIVGGTKQSLHAGAGNDSKFLSGVNALVFVRENNTPLQFG